MSKKLFYDKIKKINGLDIIYEQELRAYTTFKIGGPAQIFIVPYTIVALKKLLPLIDKERTFILGSGSNIIISDKGFKGIVIYTGKLNQIKTKNNKIIAQSGAPLVEVSKTATDLSLTGLEFASGIPGSIGGALYMNAGAYGGEIKDIITEAEFINYQGEKFSLPKEKLNLSYRHSILQEKPLLATRITLQLKPGSSEKIIEKVDELTKKRWKKQPMEWPSAGSMFKRKEGYYPGKLIEEAGLKGFNVNDAQISTKHAGFIINKGQATAQDVKELVKKVKQKVAENSGVKLETEPRFID